MRKDVVGYRNQCVLLSEHLAILADEGQTVYIGIDDYTKVKTSLTHLVHDALQVFLQRFGIVSKLSCAFAVKYLKVNA